MYLAIISLLTGLAISAVAIYYSVVGLTAIFAAAAIPIMVMGVALEVAKLVATVWLKQNWKIAPALIKTYLVTAVCVLMFITSMGIFGFLSKAHMDQTLVSGDVISKIAVYDEKIKTEKENIEANRKALKQMDEGVDQVLGRSADEKGADKAVALRRSQQKERTRLQNEISQSQKSIAELNDVRAPIAAEVRKVEAEVGPIKYIAAFIYGDNPDANLLEKAVTWVIVIIVFVFDPLAVALLLAAQYSFARIGIAVDEEDPKEKEEEKVSLAQRLANKIKGIRQYFSDSIDTIKTSVVSPLNKNVVADTILEPIVDIVENKAEGDSLTTESDPNIVAEETTVTETIMPLEEMKDKLNKFVEAITPPAPEFNSKLSPIIGFVVPKIDNAVVDQRMPTTKETLETAIIEPTVKLEYVENNIVVDSVTEEEDNEIPFGVSVDNWNKLIAEAEKAVESEFNYPENPKRGQRVIIKINGQERNAIFNGETWINADESNADAIRDLDDEFSKYKLLHELRDHNSGYVQNEEQQESNLWNETRESLSQEDYQIKVQENQAKESNDGQNNTNKSA
jgi:hypothetical protein